MVVGAFMVGGSCPEMRSQERCARYLVALRHRIRCEYTQNEPYRTSGVTGTKRVAADDHSIRGRLVTEWGSPADACRLDTWLESGPRRGRLAVAAQPVAQIAPLRLFLANAGHH